MNEKGTLARSERAELEAALRAVPSVEDVAVDTCDAQNFVAYLVASRNVSLDTIERAIRAASLATSRVKVALLAALPLTLEGSVDEAVLRGLPTFDIDVATQWQTKLRETRGVSQADVSLAALFEKPGIVHVADLLTAQENQPPHAPPKSKATTFAGTSTRMSTSDGGTLPHDPVRPKTMIEALLRTVRRNDGKGITAIASDGACEHMTYAAIHEDALLRLRDLRRHGLRPGDIVILHIESLLEFFATFWACVLGGIVPLTVSVSPSYAEENGMLRKLRSSWEFLGHPPIVTSEHLVSRVLSLDTLLGMRSLVVWTTMRSTEGEDVEHISAPGDLMFLQLTSGSTGAPKCVRETHFGVVCDVTTYGASQGSTPDDVTLNWFPMDHVLPFLYHHIKSVLFGCEQVHVRTDYVIADPNRWLDLISAKHVTHTWSPNFGLKLLVDATRCATERTWNLSALRCLLTAGEPISPVVLDELVVALGRYGFQEHVLQPAYGMTECSIAYQNAFSFTDGVRTFESDSLAGVLAPTERGTPGSRSFVHVGLPMIGIEIRIVDAEDRVLPEKVFGRVQARRNFVPPRYYPDAPISPCFASEGWIDTGDNGFLLDGRLTVSGRAKEMIIVRGTNIFCHEVEEVAAKVLGVASTFVGACAFERADEGTEGVAVFFVPARGFGEGDALVTALRGIRARVTSEIGVAPTYVVPLAESDFPKTSSGKVQRAILRQHLAEGKYDGAVRSADRALRNANTCADTFFRKSFRRRELPDEALPCARGRPTLVFIGNDSESSVIERVLASRGGFIRVERGSHYECIDRSSFRINPTDEGDYLRLFDDLAAEGVPNAILFAWSSPRHSDTTEPLVDQAFADNSNVACVHRLLRRLAAMNGSATPIRLVVRAPNALEEGSELVASEGRILVGLLRAASYEHRWLRTVVVDTAAEIDLEARGVSLARELGSHGDREVLHRDGVRLVPRLLRAKLASEAIVRPPLGREALVLLAGGLSTTGGALARQLWSILGARVLIVGRTSFDVIADEPNGAAAEKRALLAELVRNCARTPGAALRYEAVDVADAAKLANIVADAEREWSSPLALAIHLVGTGEHIRLDRMAPSALAAKLRGTVACAHALDMIMRARPMARLATFSRTGEPDEQRTWGAEAIREAFVEGFARENRGDALCFRSTAAHAIRGQKQGVDSSHYAVALLAAMVRAPGTLVAGLSGDDRGTGSAIEVATRAPFGLRASVEMSRGERTPESWPSPREVSVDATVTVNGSPISPNLEAHPTSMADIEMALAAIWRDVLGVEVVAPEDGFFELGGSSVLLVQVVTRLEKVFGRKIRSRHVFEYPTVRKMAEYLKGEIKESAVIPTAQDRGQKRRGALRARR